MRVFTSLRTLAPVLMLLIGCGGEAASTEIFGDGDVAEGALTRSAQSLVGPYASDEDTYATEIDLAADGSFTAKFNPEVVGRSAECNASPCVVAGEGSWNVSALDRLVLKVKKIEGERESRSLTFEHRLARGVIPTLTLDRVTRSKGEQSFRGHGNAGNGCAAARCAAGTRCVERSNGQAVCVADETDASCPCGATCSSCGGRPGCVETAVRKFCRPDGTCGALTRPVCDQ